MNHWHEPEALGPESTLPYPLELPPQTPAQQQERHAAAVRRQIHAEAMRDNPNGPFRLLGSGLFKNVTVSHLATGVLGILAGAAVGYYVGNVLMAPGKKKAKANGRKRSKARANFKGKREDFEDLDPATWDDDQDDQDDGDEGDDQDGDEKSK